MAMTAEVKDELSRLVVNSVSARRAEVSALLRFAGGLHIVAGRVVVEAEVDLRTARGIEAEVRDRLVAKLGPVIRVVVDQHRSQARNRERALDEVEKRLCEALVEAVPRKPTRPRRGAVERRLEAKRRRGARKAERRRDWD